MNIWAFLGLIFGSAMVLVGAAFANGLSPNSDTFQFGVAIAAILLTVSACGFIKHTTTRLAALSIGTPVVLIAVLATNSMTTQQQPVLALSQVSAAVERGRDGHFRADAVINGASSVEMLVDTGASVVLLSYNHAEMLDLNIANLNFNVPVITASGRSSVALVKLSSVNVGGVTLNGIQAAVALPGELKSSLLGMSYLGELEEVVLRGNEMILRN